MWRGFSHENESKLAFKLEAGFDRIELAPARVLAAE